MASSIPLSPNAFITEAQAEAFIFRGSTPSAGDQDAIVNGINWATARMESKTGTGRKLHWRNYTQPVTPAGQWTAQSAQELLLAPPNNVPANTIRGGDDLTAVVGVLGCRVGPPFAFYPPGNTVNLTLTSNATADPGVVTFGSARMKLDGPTFEDRRTLVLEERPLNTLFGIWKVNGDGTKTAVDLTNAIIDYDTAKIILVQDFFPRGDLALEVEANCGFIQPTNSTLGHEQAWNDMVMLTELLLQLYWQNYRLALGRLSNADAGQLRASVSPSRDTYPPDICALLDAYRRRGW